MASVEEIEAVNNELEEGSLLPDTAEAEGGAKKNKKKKRKKNNKSQVVASPSFVEHGPGVKLIVVNKNSKCNKSSEKGQTSEKDQTSSTSTLEFDEWARNALGDTLLQSAEDAAKTAWEAPGRIKRRQKTYVFSGELRPATVTQQSRVFHEKYPNIERPDYADHPEGHCLSEQAWPENRIHVYEGSELEIMREACRIGREVLDITSRYAYEGVTGDQLDKILTQACIDREVYPSPLNYYRFPKSVCTSVNEVICHGIPDMRPLRAGDIVNLDVSIYHKGFHSDLNETFFVGKPPREESSGGQAPAQAQGQALQAEAEAVGGDVEMKVVEDSTSTSPVLDLVGDENITITTTSTTTLQQEAPTVWTGDTERVVRTAYESLVAAAKMIKPGCLYRSVGGTIQKVAEGNGCSVVTSYCGHGVGKLFHGPPQVPHYRGSKTPGIMKAGHIFTIEPMINLGANNSQDGMWPDDWTAVTMNGALSAQFEHTFLVTENGYECLTLSRQDILLAEQKKKKGAAASSKHMPEWEDIEPRLRRCAGRDLQEEVTSTKK
ncbi:unnamed protein product [Amoebophrya sp. A25]|nr:unnamed protein product [Amoebophrya sp. A25]CAD7976966.1 unnamed protein product [Amoebophrya sp. A25]|eukprot:GSA25T00027781001.1